jgi:lysophospholipase L1-like esterase
MRAHALHLVLLCVAPPAIAQDFLAVPVVVTSDRALFANLFSDARTSLLHAALVGDSQETCPHSHGLVYVPAFNAAWAVRYATCGRTPLVQPGQNFAAPYGEWLVRGEVLFPMLTDMAPPFAPDALPGLSNWTLPAPTANQRGWVALLQPHATSVINTVTFDRERTWLDTSQGVYLDVYALRDPSYGNVAVRWSLAPTDEPSGAAPALGQGQTNLAAAFGSSPVARQRFGPITWNPAATSGGSIQAELTGADASKPARVLSVSFVSVASPVGIAVTDIAEGGYNATSFVAGHAAALPQLGGLDLDCAFISLGANDAWYPPATFKQSLTALIATIRANTTPDLPIILMGDPHRRYLSAGADLQLEQFPRICAELATELPRVCAVNSRRLTHEYGWTPDSGNTFLSDGVHYNADGSMLKANLEVEALWNTFVCQADIGVQGGLPGHDGLLDNNDFVVFIDSFFSARPVADMGRQGGLLPSDGRFDNNDFVVFIDAFFTGCPF